MRFRMKKRVISGLMAGLLLGMPAAGWAAGDFASRLDPELVPAFEQSYAMDLARTGPDFLKQRAAGLVGSPSLPKDEAVEVHDRYIPNGDGTGELRLRIYTPKETEGPLPCIYWIHGGGFLFGVPEQNEAQSLRFAREVGAVVVAVDYRLAPEHPYPAPLEDCYAGLRWVFQHGEELGVDTERVAVAGASAGGNLCAAVTLLARDRGEFMPAFQMPLYPMLDDRMETPSSREETDPRVWNSDANRYGWHAYIRDIAGTDAVTSYMAPAREEDLSGLPPAYSCIGTLEPFRDEVIRYMARLAQAGVPVEFHIYPRAFHAFEAVARGTEYSRQVEDEYVQVLKKALHP